MSPSQARTARTAALAAATAATNVGDDDKAARGRAVEAPLVLDRYRLHKRLGAGAFGTVWMAHDERLQRDVAVKLLARERIAQGRFEREARAAARLSHPGIVTLYEAAVDDEGAYLVSELVRGSTLDDLLTAGRLSDRDVLEIAVALCDALDHAHAHGVVHRDVKPSNVLVPDRTAGTTAPAAAAKLTDFGVARVTDSDGLTLTGDVLGTLAYMAPEQAEGKEVGASADLYSLALVVYEALTGVNPVSDSRAFQRARRLGAYLPPLRRQRRELPVELGRAIDTALRPRPRDRGTVIELRRALAAARPRVDDEPGVVADPFDHDDAELEPEPLAPRGRSGDREPAGSEPDGHAGPALVWPGRALAAGGAAAFAAAGWHELVPSVRSVVLGPATVAAAGAVLTLFLPRFGWAAITLALSTAAIISGHAGGAVVVVIAALLPVALMPLRPTAWPLAAAAPALGLLGLAGAWPAVAARARGPATRAALGAIGWVWLLLAGAISGRLLYLPHVPGVAAPSAWTGSVTAALDHVLAPYGTTGALAPAVVWAVAALIAPWLVRGRTPVLDVVRAAAWAILLVGATSAAVVAVHGSDAIGSAPTAILGGVVAAGIALVGLAVPAARKAWRSSPIATRLP